MSALHFLGSMDMLLSCIKHFFTSVPTEEQKQMFNIMMKARAAAYRVLKAGVEALHLDQAVREVLLAAGLNDHIMHHAGHGIGMGNHEEPALT